MHGLIKDPILPDLQRANTSLGFSREPSPAFETGSHGVTPSWPRTHCLCLLNARIKTLCHPTLPQLSLFMVIDNTCTQTQIYYPLVWLVWRVLFQDGAETSSLCSFTKHLIWRVFKLLTNTDTYNCCSGLPCAISRHSLYNLILAVIWFGLMPPACGSDLSFYTQEVIWQVIFYIGFI